MTPNEQEISKLKLHFAHANGFPASSYRALFEQITPEYDLLYIEKMAHSPDFPLNDNWESTADEIIDNIESHSDAPVIGVGHSFGSLATLQAALKRPELFSQIVLLDPPLVMGLGCAIIYLCKKLGLMDKITPAGVSKHRRQQWPSFDEAFEYFKARSLFKRYSDDALKDYIKAATLTEQDGTLTLHYRVQIECDTFRTMPHNLECKRTRLPIPSTLIYGSESDVLRSKYAKRLNTIHGMTLVETKGGHLFPMEYPKATADALKRVIQAQQTKI